MSTEYLDAAKSATHLASANADRIPGLDGTPDHFMAAARTDAAVSIALSLVSIAESLAVMAGDLREERMRSESLRQALAEARAEVDESAELIDRVWKIVNSDGTDVARLAAVHQAVTE